MLLLEAVCLVVDRRPLEARAPHRMKVWLRSSPAHSCSLDECEKRTGGLTLFTAVLIATGCGGRVASEPVRRELDASAATAGDASLEGGTLAATDANAYPPPAVNTGLDGEGADEAGAESNAPAVTDGNTESEGGSYESALDSGALPCPLACRGKCCDALGNCQEQSDTQCGPSRSHCVDCTQFGGHCSSESYCLTSDGGTLCTQTCIGCCDATGTCQSGFADIACGQLGGECNDCVTLKPPSTCDLGSYPRACVSQQRQCPEPYSGCLPDLQLLPTAHQGVCTAAEIQGAAAACANGAATAPCSMYMGLELRANNACSKCLGTFNLDFVRQSGVVACAAPYLDAACSHKSACLADCVAQSCVGCFDGESRDGCATQVQSDACSAYVQDDACMGQVLNGAARVCNPAAYQEIFGAWLEAVATLYCAQ